MREDNLDQLVKVVLRQEAAQRAHEAEQRRRAEIIAKDPFSIEAQRLVLFFFSVAAKLDRRRAAARASPDLYRLTAEQRGRGAHRPCTGPGHGAPG